MDSERLLICGSRDWNDYFAIAAVIEAHAPGVVIHGGARGADQLGGAAAKRAGIAVEVYPADWATHGRAAGPIRNQLMLDVAHPTHVVAFKVAFDRSLRRGGTEDMVRRAKAAGIPVTIVDPGFRLVSDP